MIEATVDSTTADASMETFVCRPERGGPYPAVFFLMDAYPCPRALCGVRACRKDF